MRSPALPLITLLALVVGGCGLLLDPDARREVTNDGGGDDAEADDAGERPWEALYTLVPSPTTCPEGWSYAGFAEGCLEERMGCGPAQSSLVLIPQVLPWQELRGYVRGLQGQSSDAFAPDGVTLDDVYVDGVSITTVAPRRHLWTFAAGLNKPPSPGSGNSCPCDNGQPAPPIVGDAWTCETGNDTPGYENSAPIYLSDVLWDADGDAHGAGCALVTDPGWFEVRLDEPTDAYIEVRIMSDSCDDKVTVTALELEVR